jgi:hypothetical protein
MRTILAISLIAAAFAAIPVASAECVETLCADAGSYTYGSCDNGGSGNYVNVYNYDANGYTSAGVQTYCYGYPGYYSVSGIGAYALSCDASWNCDQGGAYWDGGNFFGSPFCYSQAYTYVDGVYTPTALPLCDVAGAPPAVPAVLP